MLKAITPAVASSSVVPNTVVLRDANGNAFANNFNSSSTFVVGAGGTTTLTAASARQQVLTGSSGQTFKLPDATTLTNGSNFIFNNNSSATLSVINNGNSSIVSVPAGGYVIINLLDNSTTNGSWDGHPSAPITVTWGSGTTGLVFNTALTTTPSISAGISSASNPSFIPQRGSTTTGYGGDSTHLYGSIGGSAAFTATSTSFNIPSGASYQVNGVSISTLAQTSKSADYTTVLADAGTEIYHPSTDNNARTFTIDSNANVPYPVGTLITFTNAAATSLSIAITSDTLTLAGTTTTGTRTLAQNGTATAAKKTSTTWIISGAGLT